MRVLGIDYGSKKIGLALSDDNFKIAFPKRVLDNNEFFFDTLKDFIKQNNVVRIVLGDSKDFKMNDNPIMEQINKFKERLEKEFNLEVILFSEVLSSHQAAKMAGNKNHMIDASAATIILQSYLDGL
jgi:putative Holliday junction resolvase